MKPLSLSWRMTLAVALGLLLGLGVRKALPSSGGSASSEQPAATRPGRLGPPSAEASSASGRSDPSSLHTLAAFKELGESDRYVPPELQANVERMATTDLKALLAELDTNFLKVTTRTGTRFREALIHAAIAELYRREGENSLRWAQALGPPADDAISRVFSDLLGEMVYHDPVLACQWIAAGRSGPDHDEAESRLRNICSRAATVSTQALLEAEAALECDDSGLGSSASPTSFAADFDFRRYLAESRSSRYSVEAMKYWAAIDPEAAFTGSLGRIAESPTCFGDLCKGVIISQGDAAAATWAADKVRQLPESIQHDAIRHMASLYSSESSSAREARLRTFMQALEGNPLRWVLAISGFSPGRLGPDHQPDVSILKMLGSEELQTLALTDQARFIARYPTADDERSRQGCESAMDQLGFSEASRERVRAGFQKQPEDGQ